MLDIPKSYMVLNIYWTINTYRKKKIQITSAVCVAGRGKPINYMSHLQGWIINFSSNSGKSLVPAIALSLIFYSTGLWRCPVLSYYYNHITYYSRVHGRKSPWRIPLYISLKCNQLPNQKSVLKTLQYMTGRKIISHLLCLNSQWTYAVATALKQCYSPLQH